jgi:hypothetical protein
MLHLSCVDQPVEDGVEDLEEKKYAKHVCDQMDGTT